MNTVNSGIIWEYKNGLFEIKLIKNHVEVETLQCSKDHIFQIIDGLIGSFHTISAHAGTLPPQIRPNDSFNRAATPLSRFRLAQNPSPELTTIVLGVGELELGFSIPTAELTDLGQALLAAGVVAPAKPN
jgi:hypothetical protein